MTATAKGEGLKHHPPVDYRLGWDLGRFLDQATVVFILIASGTTCLFAAPTCTPWSGHVRGKGGEKMRYGRLAEMDNVRFLTMICFIQFLIGGFYVIENPTGSDIWRSSPLQGLGSANLPLHTHGLHQCRYVWCKIVWESGFEADDFYLIW